MTEQKTIHTSQSVTDLAAEWIKNSSVYYHHKKDLPLFFSSSLYSLNKRLEAGGWLLSVPQGSTRGNDSVIKPPILCILPLHCLSRLIHNKVGLWEHLAWNLMFCPFSSPHRPVFPRSLTLSHYIHFLVIPSLLLWLHCPSLQRFPVRMSHTSVQIKKKKV